MILIDRILKRYCVGFLDSILGPNVDNLKKKRDIEELVRLLKDGNMFTGEQAADALGLIGDPRTVEPLMTALKNEKAEVRKNAA
jgi:HEAT repeat protein